MFGIGMQEILVVLVIALVVIGPKKLPEIAKALGKGYGEFRRAFEEMKNTINVDIKTEEEKENLRRLHQRLSSDAEEKAPSSTATAGEVSASPGRVEGSGAERSPAAGPSPPPGTTEDEEVKGGGD